MLLLLANLSVVAPTVPPAAQGGGGYAITYQAPIKIKPRNVEEDEVLMLMM